MRSRSKYILILIAATIAVCLQGIRASAEPAENAASEFLRGVGVGASEQIFNLFAEPAGKNITTTETSVYVGNPNGTKVYATFDKADVSNDGATHKFWTSIHTDNYGVMIGARLSKMKGSAFTIGIGKKTINTDDFIDYVYQGTSNGVPFPRGEPEITTHPFHIGYTRDLTGPWSVGLDYDFERIGTDPLPSAYNVSTKIYTLKGTRTGKKLDIGGSISKLSSDGAPGNTNLDVKLTYKPHKNVRVIFTMGKYTKGMPTAGGTFSGIGGQFIIPYLDGETAYERLYNRKFAYFSLGVGFSR